MMLMRCSGSLEGSSLFQKQVVAADVIVMPRSCSCSIQSMMAAPSSTSPSLPRDSRVKQDALGSRRLAGIDVRHDADIPIPREWVFRAMWEAP